MSTSQGKARERARSEKCQNNLKQLGFAIMLYADQHDGKLPPNLEACQDLLGNSRILTCPAAAGPGPHYMLLGAGLSVNTFELPAKTVIAYEQPGNHRDGLAILFADGHVERIKARSIEEAVKQRDLIIPKVSAAP